MSMNTLIDIYGNYTDNIVNLEDVYISSPEATIYFDNIAEMKRFIINEISIIESLI